MTSWTETGQASLPFIVSWSLLTLRYHIVLQKRHWFSGFGLNCFMIFMNKYFSNVLVGPFSNYQKLVSLFVDVRVGP